MPIVNPPAEGITESQIATIVDNKIAEIPTPPAGGGSEYANLYTYKATSEDQHIDDINVDLTGYSEVIIDIRLTARSGGLNDSTSFPIITLNNDTSASYNVNTNTTDIGPTNYSGVNFIRTARIQGAGLFTSKGRLILAGLKNSYTAEAYMGIVNGATRTGTVAGSWNPDTAVPVTSIQIKDLNSSFFSGNNSYISVMAR